jgi:hypothetical protein
MACFDQNFKIQTYMSVREKILSIGIPICNAGLDPGAVIFNKNHH